MPGQPWPTRRCSADTSANNTIANFKVTKYTTMFYPGYANTPIFSFCFPLSAPLFLRVNGWGIALSPYPTSSHPKNFGAKGRDNENCFKRIKTRGRISFWGEDLSPCYEIHCLVYGACAERPFPARLSNIFTTYISERRNTRVC